MQNYFFPVNGSKAHFFPDKYKKRLIPLAERYFSIAEAMPGEIPGIEPQMKHDNTDEQYNQQNHSVISFQTSQNATGTSPRQTGSGSAGTKAGQRHSRQQLSASRM